MAKVDTWLENIENIANNMLDFKGYLTLYDVYDAMDDYANGKVKEVQEFVNKAKEEKENGES